MSVYGVVKLIQYDRLSIIIDGLIQNRPNSIATDRSYRQVSNIKRSLVGNYIVDHSDVVGASPVGAAPTTSSFSI